LNEKNVDLISRIFNWYDLGDLSEEEFYKMANKINFDLEKEIIFKCSFSYYKKCTVFSLNKTPLLFLKYVRENYFSEILGLHLTRYFFDPALCCDGYLTGIYQKGRLIKQEIPYILTTYVEGEDISNYRLADFKHYLGRHYYLHHILSLYDVYDRHLIVRDDKSLCRIDFGRSFENMQKNYLGFADYFKVNGIDPSDKQIQNGYEKEKEIVRKNLENKKYELAKIIRMIKELKDDRELIFFESPKFVNRLIDHWSQINFLDDMDLTKIEWI
jgi:hypothetical protein